MYIKKPKEDEEKNGNVSTQFPNRTLSEIEQHWLLIFFYPSGLKTLPSVPFIIFFFRTLKHSKNQPCKESICYGNLKEKKIWRAKYEFLAHGPHSHNFHPLLSLPLPFFLFSIGIILNIFLFIPLKASKHFRGKEKPSFSDSLYSLSPRLLRSTRLHQCELYQFSITFPLCTGTSVVCNVCLYR